MPHFYYILILLVFTILFNACSDEEAWKSDVGFELEESPVDFYFSGMLTDLAGSTPVDFQIGPEESVDVRDRYFLSGDLSQGRVSPTFLAGVFIDNFDARRSILPRIELQFWPDNIGADMRWSAAEVKSYFTTGKTFTLGGIGSDRFGFRILLPYGGANPDAEPSDADFLANPSGVLTITDVSDYEYEDIGGSVILRKGLRIICTFTAEVGRYDLEADQADGNPNYFRTDEVVRFTEGEASIFVPYEEEL